MRTKQIVFTKPYTAELLEVDNRNPARDEVTVDLEFSAISSGTERANLIGMQNTTSRGSDAAPTFPRYWGYSAAGIVSALGEGVDDLEIGDRVIVFWGNHKKNITMNRKYIAKIPDGVSMEEASMAFISTFPLAAIRKTRLELGESVLVMGLGILGLFAVKLLKAAGACPIIAVDPTADRRALALEYGADYALDPTEEGFASRVREISGGGVDVCIEVTGLGAGLQQGLDCMNEFGRVALLGCTRNPDFSVDYYRKVHTPGVSLIGAHTCARPKHDSHPGYWTEIDDIGAVLRLLKSGRLSFADMIKEIAKPEDCFEVYTRLANDRNFPIGVLFDWRTL